MDWFYPKRRGPEWKRGWTGQTRSSISTPPLSLLLIFGIVIGLLWFSQSTDYKAELHNSAVNFQLFLFLIPILLVLFMAVYSTNWMLYFRLRQPVSARNSGGPAASDGSSKPWGIALFVVLLLVLISYQSSFHSKWFGPLRRSD